VFRYRLLSHRRLPFVYPNMFVLRKKRVTFGSDPVSPDPEPPLQTRSDPVSPSLRVWLRPCFSVGLWVVWTKTAFER
jgi:hypothetical protein